jgi:hypothetical protein
MSSGFVSGGTVDNPTERDDEWRQAQAELEAVRKAKADLSAQHEGKSLFEVLQENKDKKQADFEERARYKLHVSLNDEEADYLDSIEEKRREEEAKVKKDTQEQLKTFRRQQEEEARTALDIEGTDPPAEEHVQWAAPGRKRKKGSETGLLKRLKLRKPNSTSLNNEAVDEAHATDERRTNSTLETANAAEAENAVVAADKSTSALSPAIPANALYLSLGYTTSEDEFED